jgi:hypothetical protein
MASSSDAANQVLPSAPNSELMLGGHFYNARVFLATEQVDVGGLNLKTELWQNMMDNIGSFGIENSNTLKTHGIF